MKLLKWIYLVPWCILITPWCFFITTVRITSRYFGMWWDYYIKRDYITRHLIDPSSITIKIWLDGIWVWSIEEIRDCLGLDPSKECAEAMDTFKSEIEYATELMRATRR